MNYISTHNSITRLTAFPLVMEVTELGDLTDGWTITFTMRKDLSSMMALMSLRSGMSNFSRTFARYLFNISSLLAIILHFSLFTSLIISWNGFFGNSIILWPSAQGFRPQFMIGEGMRFAQWASPVPKL